MLARTDAETRPAKGVRHPRARKSHLHLLRFACADRAKNARPSGKESGSCALLSLGGVGQGQGVFENKHSQTIQEAEKSTLKETDKLLAF